MSPFSLVSCLSEGRKKRRIYQDTKHYVLYWCKTSVSPSTNKGKADSYTLCSQWDIRALFCSEHFDMFLWRIFQCFILQRGVSAFTYTFTFGSWSDLVCPTTRATIKWQIYRAQIKKKGQHRNNWVSLGAQGQVWEEVRDVRWLFSCHHCICGRYEEGGELQPIVRLSQEKNISVQI